MEKTDAIPKQKNCAKCGTAFKCLYNKDCWCMDYKLSKDTLEELRKGFNDCLCPGCLSAYAEKA